MDGLINDLQFYILFNSILVISESWVGDNERLGAVEHLFTIERTPPQTG